ncbi:MAG: hypothetical protein A2163_03990 [Actinobacteria bacterium RBG_13_35_12]|nr:MAG: hypothetical protein A2163_03990 [Actinobacteria bacterium RBG_13_35_12]
MGYPSFIATGAIAWNADTPVTPTPPAHQADDILLVAVHNHNGGDITTGTAGWAEIAEVDGTKNSNWFWKRAAGAGTAGPALVAVGTYQLHAICYVIRGCKTTGNPFEDPTTAGNGTTTETTPDTAAIDTTYNNRLAVCILNWGGITGGWAVAPPPATWTLDNETVSTSGLDATFDFISKQIANAANVGAVVIGTATSAMTWGSLTLAFYIDEPSASNFFPWFFIKEAVDKGKKYFKDKALWLPDSDLLIPNLGI